MTVQEALNSLVKESCPKRVSCDECEINYRCNCEAKSYIDVLQKLVDRDTPKKSLIVTQLDEFGDEFGGFEIREWDEDSCPICNRFVGGTDKFCRHCGQAIDWGVENADTTN